MYAIWSRWAPPMERASLVTIPHSGKYLENDSYEFVISLTLCFNCSLYELSTIPNVPYKRVRIDVLLHANCSYCTYVLSSCLVIYCCIFFFVVYNKTYIICIISLNIGFVNLLTAIFNEMLRNICLLMKENFYFYQLYFLGSYAGSVAGTLVAGYLCEVCGWNWVFYVFGNYLE